jgi:hypothetical protein
MLRVASHLCSERHCSCDNDQCCTRDTHQYPHADGEVVRFAKTVKITDNRNTRYGPLKDIIEQRENVADD